MKKKSIATLLLLAMIVLFTGAANADPFDQVLNRWTKTIKYIDEDKISFLEIKATYYSAEFIEAYVQKEAKDNMWTQQEMEDYKYNFLAALQMTEMIPIMIEFTNNAETMHLGPFDIMVKLGINFTNL